jgi:hypothetical protein
MDTLVDEPGGGNAATLVRVVHVVVDVTQLLSALSPDDRLVVQREVDRILGAYHCRDDADPESAAHLADGMTLFQAALDYARRGWPPWRLGASRHRGRLSRR